jgi:hypothetical protein
LSVALCSCSGRIVGQGSCLPRAPLPGHWAARVGTFPIFFL